MITAVWFILGILVLAYMAAIIENWAKHQAADRREGHELPGLAETTFGETLGHTDVQDVTEEHDSEQL